MNYTIKISINVETKMISLNCIDEKTGNVERYDLSLNGAGELSRQLDAGVQQLMTLQFDTLPVKVLACKPSEH